jgi:nitrogen regulatory protein P-II 1
MSPLTNRAPAHPRKNGSTLKRVEIVISPSRLDELRDALVEVGVVSMNVSEAKVFEPTRPRRAVFRGELDAVDFMLKVEIVMVVDGSAVPRILSVLQGLPETGTRPESSVIISDVVDAVRIRTGERGQQAIETS